MKEWGDVAGLILEGQMQLAQMEARGPAVEVPAEVKVYVGRNDNAGAPWVAWMERNGRREVIHTGIRLMEVQKALEADRTFGPAAARYARLWRVLNGGSYESDPYQTAEQRRRSKERGAGAFLALLAAIHLKG